MCLWDSYVASMKKGSLGDFVNVLILTGDSKSCDMLYPLQLLCAMKITFILFSNLNVVLEIAL